MQKRHGWIAVWAAVLLGGCVTYRPAPIETLDVLRGLEAIAAPDETSGLSKRELAAFAITHHPALSATRARLGIRSALLVEAGLLPDPQLGWGAMDLVASEIVEGTSSSLEVISGFSTMLPLLRPGERDAKVALAERELELAKCDLLTAEWQLTRDVHIACEEQLVAELRLARTRELASLAGSTADYFDRAKGAGAATAIQANLARGELLSIRLEEVRAENRAQQARQRLNALLGIPPDSELPLRADEEPSLPESLRDADPGSLAEAAMSLRPDLVAREVAYRASEEGVRLAVAKQYPSIAIGTGIQITIPIFSGFGRPRIRTALARRDRAARELAASVHQVRGEIAAAFARWTVSARKVDLIEAELLPNAEETLELSREALEAGEATLLETLALQRALLEARTTQAEAIADRAKQTWELLSASGLLLPEPKTLVEETIR
ncbi:MAG: TolC family protein [Planctomycetota bacterium]